MFRLVKLSLTGAAILASPTVAQLGAQGITTSPATLDQNNNGFPDLWESMFNASSLSLTADNDGDGVSNRDEAIAGTDPRDAQDRLYVRVDPAPNGRAFICWPARPDRPGQLEASTTLGTTTPWANRNNRPATVNGEFRVSINRNQLNQFFRIRHTEADTDNDQVPDWIEALAGFNSGPNQANSSHLPRAVDLDGNGSTETTISGDLASFNDIYRSSENGEAVSRAQASRFLLHASFGAANDAEINRVVNLGYERWINEQVALPASLTRPYIRAIKADFTNGTNSPELRGYWVNTTFVSGRNFMTPWARGAIQGKDQLRQRVAFALSQIIVASSASAGLGNQPEAIATFYDMFLNNAFGNYEDILLEASLSPVMGNYLSHIGNRKQNAAIGRFPDENYAREIMQLFTIGLFELNLDGTQKLHPRTGQPIETYTNTEITQLAKVFTGLNYNKNGFGGGFRDDGSFGYMTTPMRAFAVEHDFGPKRLRNGVNANGTPRFRTIPATANRNNNTARQDVVNAVNILMRHPNTAPFVCRQLIQFLVTANPSPAYVERVATVFRGNGTSNVGDLEATIRAILLDDEAINPLQHLSTAHFGGLREPLIRTMHVARIGTMARHQNLLFWDFGLQRDETLQSPMESPTVFNYFRPDFRLPGVLAANQLDSPVFGITDSYTAISNPNRFWINMDRGFGINGFYDTLVPFYTGIRALSENVPAMVDQLSLLLCGGTLSADSRAIIIRACNSTNDQYERTRLAVFAVAMSPEAACQK